jgi:hypothetical protein
MEEPAHHRGVSLDPALRQQTLAKRLQGHVGFLGAQRFEKLTMRLQLRAEIAAHFAGRA